MRALLLAAGRGTRLRPWTDHTPKCMVPVAGKPTLVRALEWLRRNGVTDVAINLHHRPARVTEHLGDGGRFGVRIHYSYESQLRGTAGALDACRQWLGQEPFLVLYADNIVGCELSALERTHRRNGATLTIALHRREDVRSSGVARLDGESIVGFVEKPDRGGAGWVNAGLLRCERRVCDFVPRASFSDLGVDVIPSLLNAGEPVAAHRMGEGEFLHWIDTPTDLARVERLLGGRAA